MVRNPNSNNNRERLFSRLIPAVMVVVMTVLLSQAAPAAAQDDKPLDIRSSVGDLHVGSEADLQALGIPEYPGARLRQHDEHRNSANLALFTSAFGMKLVVANYDSDDGPGKVVAFYRDKLKKFGKVLECRTEEHGGDINVDFHDDDSKQAKELKCKGGNTGNIIELKAGTEGNQHVVAVEPSENGQGSTFALVLVRTRGRQGEI